MQEYGVPTCKQRHCFFTESLGLSLSYEGKGLVHFELPSGQLFEVFGSESRFYRLHTCPVLAFQVEDVRQARVELAARGVQFETDVEGNNQRPGRIFVARTATCMNSGNSHPKGKANATMIPAERLWNMTSSRCDTLSVRTKMRQIARSSAMLLKNHF